MTWWVHLQRFMHATRHRALRLEPIEWGLLLAMAVASAGFWIFIELTDEILEGDTDAFDHWVMQATRRADDPHKPRGPEWLDSVALEITALGGTSILILMILIACAYLLLIRHSATMWLLLAASVGGQIISNVLKMIIGRDRPSIVPHLSEVSTASFPSGHAMLSAVVYLTLAAVLMRVRGRKREKLFILATAALLTGLVGVSRVLLGVHYPTDVLAGWCIGAAWALICWAVAVFLQRRGAIEPEESPQ